jgi:hypothetical protein
LVNQDEKEVNRHQAARSFPVTIRNVPSHFSQSRGKLL